MVILCLLLFLPNYRRQTTKMRHGTQTWHAFSCTYAHTMHRFSVFNTKFSEISFRKYQTKAKAKANSTITTRMCGHTLSLCWTLQLCPRLLWRLPRRLLLLFLFFFFCYLTVSVTAHLGWHWMWTHKYLGVLYLNRYYRIITHKNLSSSIWSMHLDSLFHPFHTQTRQMFYDFYNFRVA